MSNAWPTLGSSRSGWIYSRDGYSPNVAGLGLLAFHQTDNSDAGCPPEGNWQYVYKNRYGRVFTIGCEQ